MRCTKRETAVTRWRLGAELEFMASVPVSMYRMLLGGLPGVPTLLACAGKLMVAIAATWAVGASLYIISVPVSIGGVTDVVLRDSSTLSAVLVREQSWYEAQGFYGFFWLALFSGLYLMAIRAAWTGNHIALAIMSVTAFALSIVTGFSIGGAYLPAALGLVIGTLMLFASTRLRARC